MRVLNSRTGPFVFAGLFWLSLMSDAILCMWYFLSLRMATPRERIIEVGVQARTVLQGAHESPDRMLRETVQLFRRPKETGG